MTKKEMAQVIVATLRNNQQGLASETDGEVQNIAKQKKVDVVDMFKRAMRVRKEWAFSKFREMKAEGLNADIWLSRNTWSVSVRVD